MNQLHVDACDSTQDLLKEQTAQKSGVNLVSTNRQTKGRGRGTNAWQDLPGSLCFSLLLPPHPVLSLTALELSVLVARFFEYEGSVLGLKWPNDLWDSRGKKCGGILLQGGGQEYLAGIGLNLYSEDTGFGGIYREPFEFDKKSWSWRVGEFIHSHRYSSGSELVKDWEARCQHMEKEVTVTENGNVVEGIFLGLGMNGEARISSLGKEVRLYNGSLRLT